MNTCLTCGEHYHTEHGELCGCYSDSVREHARGEHAHRQAVEAARAQGMEDPVFVESFAAARMTEQRWEKRNGWWRHLGFND